MMDLAAAYAARWLELTLAGVGFLALIQAVKYRGFTGDAAPGLEDLGWVSLLALAVVLAAALGPPGAVVGVLAGWLLYAALWLDAALFRIFTIELGPGGVGSIILSVLYRELAELSFGRRFFRAHRLIALLPLAAFIAQAGVLVAEPRVRLALALGLAAWLALAAAVHAPPRARAQVLVASAALAVSAAARVLAPGASVPLALGGLAGFAALAFRGAGPGTVRPFLFERPRPEPPDFQPRPEHAPLLTHAPRPPRPSPLHGTLRGCDVLLLTFESVGRAHLDVFAPGGARAPFLEGLLPGAVRSRHHACVSPTTNNAHLALYTSGYGAGGSAAVRALREAGYATVYLSTARTGDYGLRPILDAAGFEHVVDQEVLAPRSRDLLPDLMLLDEGLACLEARVRGRRPLFLHVHAAQTHVPYRVAAPDRFHRFDSAEDLGRFLNGVEECDWLFGALVEGLLGRELAAEPLRVLTSDHGQSFGGLGYHSHGSAVTREQVDVPLLLHHPRLPAREVAFSSHFDVLPTVLDLLGLQHGEPVFGDSVLHDDRRPELLLWAGHPSRRTTSHYGLLLEREKLLVDLALDRCLRTDWSDAGAEVLVGAEKEYAMALASRMMTLRGVT